MRTPAKYFKREVRRDRYLSAWIIQAERADQECRVMDISKNGAKIIAAIPSQVPRRFDLRSLKALRSVKSVTLFGDAQR
jgi:hypothetical protein